MDELALTRSKAKHPPSKTVAEAQRIRSKVEKSNTNRRQKHMAKTREQAIRATMAMPTSQRIARLEAAIDELDKEAAITNSGTAEMRLSGARLLDEEAVKLTQSDDDYPAAVRQAVGNVRPARSDADEEEVHGSVHYMDEADYERQLKQAMKDRGYEVD